MLITCLEFIIFEITKQYVSNPLRLNNQEDGGLRHQRAWLGRVQNIPMPFGVPRWVSG